MKEHDEFRISVTPYQNDPYFCQIERTGEDRQSHIVPYIFLHYQVYNSLVIPQRYVGEDKFISYI